MLRDAQVELEGRGTPALVGQRERAGQLLALVALPRGGSASGPGSDGGRGDGGDAAERERVATLAAQALRTAVARRLGEAELAVAVGRAAGWEEAGPELRLAADGAASAAPLPLPPGTTPARWSCSGCCGTGATTANWRRW